MRNRKTDFTRTRAALEAYDADRGYRQAIWDVIESVADLEVAEAVDQLDIALVLLAFHEDTREFNSEDNVRLIHPDDPWFRAATKEGAREASAR